MPYVFCTMALVAARASRSAGRRLPRATAWSRSLAFVYAMGAIAGAGSEAVFWGFLLLIAGLPVYVLLKRAHTPMSL